MFADQQLTVTTMKSFSTNDSSLRSLDLGDSALFSELLDEAYDDLLYSDDEEDDDESIHLCLLNHDYPTSRKSDQTVGGKNSSKIGCKDRDDKEKPKTNDTCIKNKMTQIQINNQEQHLTPTVCDVSRAIEKIAIDK